MKPKADKASIRAKQRQIKIDEPQPLLRDFINTRHELVLLADKIDWEAFEPHWNRHFSTAGGPKANSSRLVAGLLILKHMQGLSDEATVSTWVCNPYWQYFCGETHFQHDAPVYPSTIGRWRKQLGEEGLEYLLEVILLTAVKTGALEKKSMAHVCVDSTVMEKNISYPTDSALLLKILQQIVSFMKDNGLSIRQSYVRTAPRITQKIGRYAHARQFKRMRILSNGAITANGL